MIDRDIGDRTNLNRRNPGMGTGTIVAIIAVLVVIGALFMWAPWSDDTSKTGASPTPATTTGQSSSAPVTTTPNTNTTPGTPASPPASQSPATSEPTTNH